MVLKNFVEGGKFNFELLFNEVRKVVRALNKVVDINNYSTEKGRKGGLEQRAIAIGTQGLADVFYLMDYILVLTDQAAYTIQFVGPPFTFSIRQVGTNCGCLGQHAMIFAQGAVFWMGFGGGFFAFDGTVKQIPSLVEDFVFTTDGDNLGINYDANQITYAYHNSLYNAN